MMPETNHYIVNQLRNSGSVQLHCDQADLHSTAVGQEIHLHGTIRRRFTDDR